MPNALKIGYISNNLQYDTGSSSCLERDNQIIIK